MRKATFSSERYRGNPNFRFCVLVGVLQAYEAGGIVHGAYKAKLTRRCGGSDESLIERFANCPGDVESIVKFVLEFGPLRQTPIPSSTFQFPVSEFITVQNLFKESWRTRTVEREFGLHGGSMLFQGGSITYLADTLESFLNFDLLTAPANRAKVCKRLGCIHPFFFTDDLKRRFCSDGCSIEGRRELKQNWYREHGKAWQQENRAKAKKEQNDGPNKER